MQLFIYIQFIDENNINQLFSYIFHPRKYTKRNYEKKPQTFNVFKQLCLLKRQAFQQIKPS